MSWPFGGWWRLGEIVVAGRRLPVVGLALRDGQLQITATIRATRDMPPVTDQPAAVFGADGQGVCQGWRVSIPEVPAGVDLTVVLPIRIASLELEDPPGP